jgi:hypothetical protein
MNTVQLKISFEFWHMDDLFILKKAVSLYFGAQPPADLPHGVPVEDPIISMIFAIIVVKFFWRICSYVYKKNAESLVPIGLQTSEI